MECVDEDIAAAHQDRYADQNRKYKNRHACLHKFLLPLTRKVHFRLQTNRVVSVVGNTGAPNVPRRQVQLNPV